MSVLVVVSTLSALLSGFSECSDNCSGCFKCSAGAGSFIIEVCNDYNLLKRRARTQEARRRVRETLTILGENWEKELIIDVS